MSRVAPEWLLKGTAADVADQLEHWFKSEAADGFNLLPQIVPRSIIDFVDLVVPELQRRGLFRTEYEVAWMRPEGRRPYFVGRVRALIFQFAP